MPSLSYESDAGSMDEQDDRLVGILDQYLIDIEQGLRPNIESIVALNGDLEQPLRESFEALSLLRNMDADLPQPAMRLDRPIPNRLDDFELGAELGRGAAGIVYAARQVSLDRPVAVKVLAFCSAIQSSRVERFYREATAAALLDHPHIVTVVGVGCCEGTHYYAMNRVDGASLDRRIDAAQSLRDDSLSAPLAGEDRYRRIALFMADAADALAHAHAAGIVHRDIKPSNLLLTDEGHIWVADFGLARIGREGNLTRSGDLVGTIRYMSPEQASGCSELVDGRSDIYSLGATLYELVLLRPPFEGNDSASLLREIQSSEPATPRSLDRRIPKPLEIIIRRAIRRSASERYATASELADDLRRFAAGQPIHAARVTLAERWVGYARDHSAIVATAFLLAMITIAAAVTHSVIVARQQLELRHALALSQANYTQARRAVDTLGADVARRLVNVPEAAELRRDVLAETLSYYESFIAEANDDPALVADVAKTRLKIAQLIHSGGNAFAEIDQAYQSSATAMRAASQRMNDDVTDTLLVQTLNEWSMLRCGHGQYHDANELLDEALSVAAKLTENTTRDVATALVRNNRGVVAFKQGHTDEAMIEMKAAVTLFKLIVSNVDVASPTETLVSDLAASVANLGTMMSDAGNQQAAVQLVASSIAIRERLGSNRYNDSPSELRRRALTHNNLAALRWRAGEVQEAIASYATAVAFLEQASEKLPGLASVRRELAVALNNQGMALASAKAYDQAESAFHRAIAIAQPAADADPSDMTAARECGGILNNLGVLLRDQGRRDDAKVVFVKAIEQQRRAGNLAPNDVENHRFLDKIRHNYVSVER